MALYIPLYIPNIYIYTYTQPRSHNIQEGRLQELEKRETEPKQESLAGCFFLLSNLPPLY